MGATAAPTELVPLAAAAGLALVHVVAGWIHPDEGGARGRWHSFSGGVSVAYVFVHLLPEVGEGAVHVGTEPFGLGFLERHVFLIALVGFVAYYGVERAAKLTDDTDGDRDHADLFRMHVGAFALYNLLVGYLLVHRETPGLTSLVLFAVAMGTHFVVNDWGLRQHHGEPYRRYGRWLLAAAVVGGAVVGLFVPIDRAALALLFAFLAGGIVLNVVKEEVPAERESRFWAFAGGTGAYTTVLLLV